MEIKIFGRENCPKCQAVKEKLQLLKGIAGNLTLTYYDMDTIDGLTEATYYGVGGIPTTIIVDYKGIETARWCGEVPQLEDIKRYL